jgi:hypothetical protein
MSADAQRGASEPGRAPPRGAARGSLCPECRHVQSITSDKGSVFWLCRRSRADPRYPKYPPQPVVSCPGFERYPSTPA